MADEPNGTNGDSGSQPPPPPLASAPPPLASAPPSLAAAPPPAPVPAAAGRPFFSPPVVVAIMLALLLAVLAILYFSGVFDRMSAQRTEQTTAPTAVPPASETPPPEAMAGTEDNPFATPANPPPDDCDGVYSEQEARALPQADGPVQTNRLTVTASGTILWNGAVIDAVRLRQYLDIVSTMAPIPRTVVRIEPGAPAALADEVGAAIGRSLNCSYRPS